MHTLFLAVISAVIANAAAADGALKLLSLAGPGTVPDSLIVGRASCLGSSWLLNEDRQLVEISNDGRLIRIHAVSGLAPAERVWGLGCLSDGSLWTLASARTVARLDGTGRVLERVQLEAPRVALFGAGDGLLFQGLRVAVGSPALAVSPPRQPGSVRPWPGLNARAASAPEQRIARNLVSCGLGVDRRVPCWFADDNRFSISDGLTSRSVELPELNAFVVDQAAPIWDVALHAGKGFWLLASSRGRRDDRRAGGRLLRVSDTHESTVSVALDPPARMIIAADDFRCLLVTINGGVVDVGVRR